MKNLTITLLTITILAACASTTKDGNKRFHLYDDYIVKQELKSVIKIRSFKFLNWKSLDNKHLIVSSSHRNQYLVTLHNYCVDLDVAHTIAFDQSMSNSLSSKFDSIVISGQINQKCRISTIHKLDDDQEKVLLKLRKNYYKKGKAKIET